MAFIKVKRAWTKQPPTNTPIDLTHPFSKGLVCAINGANHWDSVTRTIGALENGAARIATKNGLATDTGGAGTAGLSIPNNIKHNATELSIIVFIDRFGTGNSGFNTIAAKQVSDGTNRSWYLGRNSPGAGRKPSFGFTAGGSSRFVQGSGSGFNATSGVFGVTFKRPDVKFYKDGELFETVSLDFTPDASDIGDLTLGKAEGESGLWADFDHYLFLAYNIELSGTEMLARNRNPWSVYQPRTVSIHMPADAGVAIPIMERYYRAMRN